MWDFQFQQSADSCYGMTRDQNFQHEITRALKTIQSWIRVVMKADTGGQLKLVLYTLGGIVHVAVEGRTCGVLSKGASGMEGIQLVEP